MQILAGGQGGDFGFGQISDILTGAAGPAGQVPILGNFLGPLVGLAGQAAGAFGELNPTVSLGDVIAGIPGIGPPGPGVPQPPIGGGPTTVPGSAQNPFLPPGGFPGGGASGGGDTGPSGELARRVDEAMALVGSSELEKAAGEGKKKKRKKFDFGNMSANKRSLQRAQGIKATAEGMLCMIDELVPKGCPPVRRAKKKKVCCKKKCG